MNAGREASLRRQGDEARRNGRQWPHNRSPIEHSLRRLRLRRWRRRMATWLRAMTASW